MASFLCSVACSIAMHEFMYQHEAVRFFLDEDTRPSDANNALLFGLAADSLDLLRALWSDSGGDLHTSLQFIILRHSIEIAYACERIGRQMRSHRYGTCCRYPLFLVAFPTRILSSSMCARTCQRDTQPAVP